ncbi:MAG TPA: hypothetical protein VIT01_08010, partial [Acidimicrobiales bacterium]
VLAGRPAAQLAGADAGVGGPAHRADHAQGVGQVPLDVPLVGGAGREDGGEGEEQEGQDHQRFSA